MQDQKRSPVNLPIPVVDGVHAVAGDALAWFVDIWGVIHNGAVPYAEAVDACRAFRARGGVVLLISNSPRPADGVQRQLDDIGVSAEAWDGIVTSGDVTRHLISDWGERSVFHLGPERDLGLFEGLAVKRVEETDADGVVCSGLFDDTHETPEDYRAMLSQFANRKLPMICANPDLKVERAGVIIYCAGALAKAYEDLGGQVLYGGKPHRPIYDLAMEELARIRNTQIDRSDVVAIGDGVNTDIAGAVGFGIRAIYIASRVHLDSREELRSDVLETVFEGAAGRPIAAMTLLK